MLSTMSSRSDEDVDEDALKCAIEACINAQAVINFSAQNLYGLRTQCSSSLELTQIEIKTLEVGRPDGAFIRVCFTMRLTNLSHCIFAFCRFRAN